MPDHPDVEAIITAAAHAATLDDAARAASLLQEALDLQVATLGPLHRDLAPTLNNLALMLERQGDADEAERCYRRAYDIARRSAGPDDPLVQVSRANLADFLRASGRSGPVDADVADEVAREEPVPPARMELMPPAPPQAAPPVPAAAMPPAPPMARPAARPRVAAPPARWRPARVLAAGLALTIAAVAWFLAAPVADPPATLTTETPAEVAAEPRPVAPPPPSAAPAAARETPAVPPPAASDARPSPRNGETAAVTADASLCESLSRSSSSWRCAPLRSRARPDAVYYYTRVKSARAIVVRHRWTHEGTVVRTVSLRVGANTEAGFRTFSRQSLGTSATGQWEVALLAPGGAVIDSQRFAVP